jgi:hypothetical protein
VQFRPSNFLPGVNCKKMSLNNPTCLASDRFFFTKNGQWTWFKVEGRKVDFLWCLCIKENLSIKETTFRPSSLQETNFSLLQHLHIKENSVQPLLKSKGSFRTKSELEAKLKDEKWTFFDAN